MQCQLHTNTHTHTHTHTHTQTHKDACCFQFIATTGSAS